MQNIVYINAIIIASFVVKLILLHIRGGKEYGT
jgi:hypothetical protein